MGALEARAGIHRSFVFVTGYIMRRRKVRRKLNLICGTRYDPCGIRGACASCLREGTVAQPRVAL